MRLKGKKPIFNYKDTYSLDETLRPIILEGLVKFKDVLQEREEQGKVFGVPHDFIVEGDDDNLMKSTEKWFECLDKMIYAFGDNEPEYTCGFHEGPEHNQEEFSEEFGVVYKWDIIPNDQEAFDRHIENIKIHQEKVQEGLELFGKYYNNLWW